MRTAETGILPVQFCGRDPENEGRERAAGHHGQRKFQIGVKNMRSEDSDKQAAHGASERNHHVKTGEVPRVGLESREFSVADHAADEERSNEGWNGPGDVGISFVGVSGIGCAVERDDEQRKKDAAMIDLVTFKAQDEAEQVDRERQHPEERNGRDVLAEVI